MDVLLLAHVLGDFYFQSNQLASRKQKDMKALAVHVGIYSLCILIGLVLYVPRLFDALWMTMVIALSHFVIDIIKLRLEPFLSKYDVLFFCLDQFLHIIILWLCSDCLSIYERFFDPILYADCSVIMIIAMMLFCGKPASILIAKLFQKIPQTVEASMDESVRHQESVRIGSWIGILEREIIFLLALLGQYGAIGFVMAAKSIARHKQLNEVAFAEKYLVGTLLSALIALLCAIVCRL